MSSCACAPHKVHFHSPWRNRRKEIPKLRTMLDTLLADGSIVPGSKLATELLAFADRMERRITEETRAAQKKVEEKQADEGEVVRRGPRGITAHTYFALRDAAAARPGMRQLVHLADIQRSVQRNLAEQSAETFVQQFQLLRAPGRTWNPRKLIVKHRVSERRLYQAC
ncbi:hypothetical protein EI94DRAFT_915317 [Lactarius quietus]|nr:hypothetical protein EI94DRAFT_915317 [Lactarius quietus]